MASLAGASRYISNPSITELTNTRSLGIQINPQLTTVYTVCKTNFGSSVAAEIATRATATVLIS
jgi:hypothetical protein